MNESNHITVLGCDLTKLDFPEIGKEEIDPIEVQAPKSIIPDIVKGDSSAVLITPEGKEVNIKDII